MSFHKNSSKDTLLNFMLNRPTTEVIELAERLNDHELIYCEIRSSGKKAEIVKDSKKKVSRGLLAEERLGLYEFTDDASDDGDEEADDTEDEYGDDDDCDEDEE